ncbi:MAG: isocitrate/isopropylmalate family dehydrogenase [Caldimonas sp.]
MSYPQKEKIPATLIPGDGIGPEVVAATVQVLDVLGSPFAWDVQQAGLAGVAAAGDPLPAATLASIRTHRLALKGPLTTPIGGGFRSSNVRLREEFELFANVRPARTLVPGRFENIDLVLVRENLGGFYVAHEYYVPIGNDPRAAAVSTGINTREGSRRIARFAFEYALGNGRKKVTVVHKANILKALTGIFLEAAREVAKEYEGRVAVDDMIVDACAMQLVLDPWRFDVLLCTNLFGDILSDEMAGLVGGLGMAPGANVGVDAAIFEAVHGSAPDIAGKGVANPTSLLLAAAMMLDHVGLGDAARRMRAAIDATLNEDGVRTRDLKGTAGTREFADAVCRRLQAGGPPIRRVARSDTSSGADRLPG